MKLFKQFAKKGKGDGTIQESSQVRAIAYHPETKSMVFTFHSTQNYKYLDVPEEVWMKALESDSIGSFLAHSVKGKYSYEKLI